MWDVHRNARVRHVFSLFTPCPAIGLVLDNLDRMSIGVGNIKVGIPNLAFAHFLRHLYALCGKIGAHIAGRISEERNMVQVAVLLRIFCKQLQVLVLVNLDKCYAVGAVVALQGVRFFVSKKVFIECARLLQVADVYRHVRNTENVRALYFISRPQNCNQTRKK